MSEFEWETGADFAWEDTEGFLWEGGTSVSASISLSISSSVSSSISSSISTSISASISSTPSPSPIDEAFIMVDSANITHGEATTYQLAPPGSKLVTAFQAGVVQDTSNQTEPINMTADKYTEIEWVIQATAAAEVGATYEFRVTKGR